MTLIQIAALIALGSFTGFCAGLLGIGGGMMMVPFLTFLFSIYGFPAESIVHIAIATSMTTILFTSLSSVRAHHKRGAVRWDIVMVLAPGIVIGGLLGGGKLFALLKTSWLSLVFASFVGFSAYQMLRNKKPKASRTLPGKTGMLGFGTVIGFLSSLVGAGGGFISVPFMLWCNVTMHNAVATSAALGFPIAVASVIGYIYSGYGNPLLPPGSFGYIYLPALACLAIASVITAPLGAKVAHQLNVAQLKKAFAFLLILLSAYMLNKGLSSLAL
ncbi:sulfite exporter TauE/SafE family protein [Polynucleobacter sp. 30F-ANTBAC]|uniref:sulfite exporter TauE/SafE family protein n=1 Tax=Polynucleobacter sp. 30F-ANTBAC TaxID=2689095 RepID=UPI001C0E544D|nr:sulfite exporter TauE/SafE family protein [Polynucleobacter sp. 30F-ANTBAC]MBU3599539.1 sulfite exporter TauE/SafE family protein [Polynucleobacter sp. 30F-ANTBAC]